MLKENNCTAKNANAKKTLWSPYPRLIESLAVFLGIIRVMTWTKKCPLKEETNFLSRK